MRFAITTPDSICSVAIDVGLRRSGRIGRSGGIAQLVMTKNFSPTFHPRSVSSAA